MNALLGGVTGVVVPVWVKWVALGALLGAVYCVGRLHEARRGGDVMADYIGRQAAQTTVIVKKQVEVQTSVQIKYVDRIQKIYVQGATIETNIPTYIQPFDNDRYGVNVGFVRIIDAAWSGDPVGSADSSDREPAGIPLDEVASVQVGNATSCRIWREKVYGWRKFYAGQQVAINGKAGEWFTADSVTDPP